MLYLSQNTTKIPTISAELAVNLRLIDQITKKEYLFPIVDMGNWYEVTIESELPVSQFDAQMLNDAGDVICTTLAQFGEFERANTQYIQEHNITAYNG